MEQRANIKFCFKLGKSATETFEMIKTAYGDEALSRKNVFKPSVTSRTEENVQKVAEILRNDRCVSARLIEELTNIPKTTVHCILIENLGKRKVCARFVPHTLTDDQKDARVQHCLDMKQTANFDLNFMGSIVTADETCDFLAKKGIVVLDHPPYSPDLAPCDFWLFPKLKLAMKGQHYNTIQDIQKAVTKVLRAISQEEYQHCFEIFYTRFQRCIDSQGMYFE
ncbi:hypothetical protein X777_15520 [Ooceraea biroi]|uniref:Mos1 transposase HTH domain-containing protein n=1 Tax=Ooceraea biroi TaxID=2015173 RepID=A0A026VVD5_OOCBI|nr:hypothetical protein X777_15520 [Ooceraea biroi]